MSLQALTGLGRALEAAYTSSLADWRAEHAPNIPMDDLLASAVTSVTIEATVFPKGRMSVIVTTRGRRQFDDETHVFRFRKRGWQEYTLQGRTLPSS